METLRDGVSSCYGHRMTRDHHPYHHGNLREALIEAAEAALEAGGIHSLTLRELCRELGVSHASSRRHFTDKRALLDALAERGFLRFGTAMGEATVDRGRSFDERLTLLARAQVGFAMKHPGLYRWMFEAKHRPDAPAELLRASEEAISRALVVYKEGQATGALVEGDPERLGLVGFAAVQGLIAISEDGKVRDASLESVAEEIMTRIILGLRPRSTIDGPKSGICSEAEPSR